MAQPSHQPLPCKEAAAFRQLVKLYESKQYKKAIKAADQILKKFPEHGETLAMKVCCCWRAAHMRGVCLARACVGGV
jgi:peptide alpha-N-acetyltransferase